MIKLFLFRLIKNKDFIDKSFFTPLLATVSAMSSCVVYHLTLQVHTKLKILADFQK